MYANIKIMQTRLRISFIQDATIIYTVYGGMNVRVAIETPVFILKQLQFSLTNEQWNLFNKRSLPLKSFLNLTSTYYIVTPQFTAVSIM